MTRVVLVGCGKTKAATAQPACMLYTGPIFRAGWEAALSLEAARFIVSAKHGLLMPNEVVDPYDMKMSENDAEEWGFATMHQLSRRVNPDESAEIVIFAGAAYADPLAWQLPEYPFWTIRTPLKGLGTGDRRRALGLIRHHGLPQSGATPQRTDTP